MALIVTDFNACRLLLGALRLLGDLSVTCAAPAITLQCVHVPLCVRDRVQQESVSFPLCFHTPHTWHLHTINGSLPTHPLPPATKRGMLVISLHLIHQHPKHINLILLFHHQGEPNRHVIVERMPMMNFHPFSLAGCTNYHAFGQKKKV